MLYFRSITEAKINDYLSAISLLETEYPNVTFIYMTDAVDKAYNPFDPNQHWGYNWLQRRNQLKQFVEYNDKVMFDYGELETWSADGTMQNTFIDWYYNVEVPLMHNDWLGEYDGGEGSCHINQAGATMKAKAFWWILARIAGWDGLTTPNDSDFNMDCGINMLDLAIFANAWSVDSNSPNWNELCDIAPSGGDGVVNYKDLAILLSAWLQAWDKPPAIISTPVTEVTVGRLYTYDVYATGCPARTYALTTFPAGMTIDAITGLIEWVPVAVGDVNVVVEATNLKGTDIQVFTINVIEPPRIENLSLTSTSGNNLVTDDLYCRYDLAGGATTAATAWYKDESPLMALYMPFEGGETKALLDVSGNGVTVTVGGKPTWNPTGDRNGDGAYEFDGYGDYISADSICADVAGRDFTIMCWIKSDYSGSAQKFIASFNTDTGDNRLLLGHPMNSSNLAIYDDGWNYTNASIIDGVYHFVGYVLSDSKDNITVYVDGESVHSFTTSTSVASDDLFSIGQEYDLGLVVSDFFDGLVGELMIYKHALSPEQISSLYNGNSDLIVSSETENGDKWQACVTPFSLTEAGTPYYSNTLTIRCYNGDFNSDCTVDFFDLAVFADAWFAEPGSPNWNDLCDVAPSGGDDVVNYKDLAVLCDEWLLVGIGS
jgi:hypothetical protein